MEGTPYIHYNSQPSRNHPQLIIILIDQSSSMKELFGSHDLSKSEAVASVVNDYIDGLVGRCVRLGEIRNYYYISLIGYSSEVQFLLQSDPCGMSQLDSLADKEKRSTEDGVHEYSVWVQPASKGVTRMTEAFQCAQNVAERWSSCHGDCHPPILFNITDGAATDANGNIDGEDDRLRKAAESFCALSCSPLVFNCHFSHFREEQVFFPESQPQLSDQFASVLYDISSTLTPQMIKNLNNSPYTLRNYQHGARGYIYNVTDVKDIYALLRTGTPLPQ